MAHERCPDCGGIVTLDPLSWHSTNDAACICWLDRISTHLDVKEPLELAEIKFVDPPSAATPEPTSQ